MNIDEKAFRADIAIGTWPETTLISRETMTARHLRRRRAEARARWPMYLPDVAYRIERLPPPRRQHGRTWSQVARDRFLASFPPGIPPWACEALKPEFRPRTIDALVEPAESLPTETVWFRRHRQSWDSVPSDSRANSREVSFVLRVAREVLNRPGVPRGSIS